MSRLKIGQGNSLSISSTGQTAAIKTAVYLQTSYIPNDPLAVESRYSGDTNHYQKRSCLRPYLLGYKHKNLPKCCFARPDLNLLRIRYIHRPIDTGANRYEICSILGVEYAL